jgi:predicted GNAT family acetyltransferase
VNGISIHYYHYMSENPVARPIYASFGFVEVGRYPYGQMIAILKL